MAMANEAITQARLKAIIGALTYSGAAALWFYYATHSGPPVWFQWLSCACAALLFATNALTLWGLHLLERDK